MTRILIVRLSSLGDLFHVLPAVHNLRVGLNARVDWVVQKEYADLVSHFTDVERVIPYYRHGFLKHFGQFFMDLRKQSYDYVIDLHGMLKSVVATRLARGGKKIGPSFHREGSRMLYPAIAGKPNARRHAVEEAMDIVKYLDLPVMEPEFPICLPDWHTDMPAPRVALIPCSRWKTKNWPVESYIDAGKALWDGAGASLFLFGGKDDAGVCDRVEAGLGGTVTNMAGKLTLVELCAALSKMDLVIAGDTGPAHAAAALGVPVLAVFGPTDALRTGPYGRWHHVVQGTLECRPCYDRVCRYGEPRCMNVIGPAEVARVALEMLKET